ncbi:MAG: hypothetical protein KDF65_02150 [Anaerolineae bacterium]|nr:hypothetical protein [Anaerolineae bacterium]
MNKQADTQHHYKIKIAGQLDIAWQTWFEGLTITPTPDGYTLLSGPIRDQADLYGVLKRINNLGLILVSVNRQMPD